MVKGIIVHFHDNSQASSSALVWRKYRYRLEESTKFGTDALKGNLYKFRRGAKWSDYPEGGGGQDKHFIFSTICMLEIDIYLLCID